MVRTTRNRPAGVVDDTPQKTAGAGGDSYFERRVLRSKYLKVKTRINEERDELSKIDSEKFKSIIDEVDGLHELVQKPREQVADAEALLDLTNTFVCSVKAYSNEGFTPADFVSSLLRDFGQHGQGSSSQQDEDRNLIRWKDVGHKASHIFRSAPGCCTMVGPMNTEVKQRKTVVRRKHTKPTVNAQPEELDGTDDQKEPDTDANMGTMFDILVANRKAYLQNLILNRISFAQTVENLFSLSFLVRDGRAKIIVDEDGHHIVRPKNAPPRDQLESGGVNMHQFIFRFDFSDWKLMLDSVVVGEELMPHRGESDEINNPQENSRHAEEYNLPEDSEPGETQGAIQTTPIRKLCRNRGFVMQEQSVVEDSPESEETAAARVGVICRGKRKLR